MRVRKRKMLNYDKSEYDYCTFTDRLPGLCQEEDFPDAFFVSVGKYIGYGIGSIIAERTLNHLVVIVKCKYHRQFLRHIQQKSDCMLYNRYIDVLCALLGVIPRPLLIYLTRCLGYAGCCIFYHCSSTGYYSRYRYY